MVKKAAFYKNVTPIVLLALFALILNVFIGYLITSTSIDAAWRENSTLITDWRFVWGGSDKELQDISQWKLATSKVEIRKEIGMSYIRLNHILFANEEPYVLQLVTANNPIRVDIDGKEVYNNQYETANYTGNKLNVIEVPASKYERHLDIYAKVPYDFSILANYGKASNAINLSSLSNLLGLVCGGLIFAIGILLMLAAAAISMQSKSLGNMMILGLFLVMTGGSLLLSQLGLHIDTLTSPWLFKGGLVLPVLTVICACSVALNSVGVWNGISRAAVLLTLAFAITLGVIANDQIIYWMTIVLPVLLLLLTVVISVRLSEAVNKEVAYAPVILFSFLLFAFSNIFDVGKLLVGLSSVFGEQKYISNLLFAFLLFVVLTKQAIHVNVRLKERDLQVEKDTIWISRVMSACSKVFIQKEKKSFFIQAARSIGELIVEEVDEENPESLAKAVQDNTVNVCVAMEENGTFTEIFNKGNIQNCQYGMIAQQNRRSTPQTIVFGNTFMDVLLFADGKPTAIIHFEGIRKGLSDNLRNSIKVAYTNIAAALDNLQLKKDIVETQSNVFIDLAEIAEQKSELTGQHLKRVSEMIRILSAELRLTEHETDILCSASMVHDIGKLAIPESIVGKTGKLTEKEYAIMKEHVIYGYNMLSRSPGEFMEAGAIIALQHHEQYNGEGYLGLRGNQIHLYARITAVADVFDALLSTRSYKDAWPYERVCDYIQQHSGKQFDPVVVEAFTRCSNRLFLVKQQNQ